ncbi:amidase [Microvirga sp. VF16]|uniref:amidase n=1 Tax=Microvirga sp. VF16 TaxID=2807101 RepID=UPI00193E2974|nr:amidase [Microvirga sp. VF16]QRM33054.1 amidase [Microvirga sp. VF16]
MRSCAASPSLLLSGAVAMRDEVLRRAISVSDLLELHIAQVEALNPRLNAVVVRDFEAARRHAHEADKALAEGVVWGPLHGIPMTVKESYDVEGLPTTWGMARFRSNVATRSGTVVQRLVQAGAIIFGKTNVAEALADWQTANGLYGTTNNPWDPKRTCGGSSGGAATAVASGMSPIEIGSDIGGSLRNPAHYCGVMAHKATFGIIPQAGETFPGTEAAVDISSNGPIARSVDDLSLVLDVIAGPIDPEASAWSLRLPPPRSQHLSGFRVAVLRGEPRFQVDQEIVRALDELAAFLSPRAASVAIDPVLPHSLSEMFDVGVSLLRAATSSRILPDQFDAQHRLADTLKPEDESYLARMTRGTTMTHRRWLELNEARARMRQAWQKLFESVDIVLCPAAASTAPVHSAEIPRYERMLSINGSPVPEADQLIWAVMSGASYLPSTVVPVGISSDGLPIGVQIISAEFNDRTCLAFARLLEQTFRRFMPPPPCT